MGGLVAKADQTDPSLNRIIPITKLTEGEIIEILGLRQLCGQRQGINIPFGGEFLRSLDKPGVGAFEVLKRERIIGFAYFYSFIKEEAEGTVFADPIEDRRAICSSLVNATIAECQRRGHERVLLMNDRGFPAGADFLIANGGKLAFSEHRMLATCDRVVPGHHVDLREVGNDDAGLRAVKLACSGIFHSKPDQRRYLASFEGKTVGKVDVYADGTTSELTGLCVIPELRGKGHGRAILLDIVDVLRAEGPRIIALDVQTDNDIALGLYLKAGFRRAFTIDYYAMTLRQISE